MYQQVTLVGNLGRDPEMRYTPSGVANTKFSIAVSKSWTNQAGERQEKTTWFNITAWRGLAEVCSKYLSKGRQVLVVGEIDEPYVYTAQDGTTRASLQVTALTVQFLGNRADADSGGTSGFAAESNGDVSSEEDIPF